MNTKNIFKTFFLCLSVISLSFTLNAQELKPLRLGVAGVSHGHLHEVLIRLERGDFEIVGVAEPDEQLRVNNPLRKKVDSSLFYADLEEMLDKTKPEAVVARIYLRSSGYCRSLRTARYTCNGGKASGSQHESCESNGSVGT